MMGSGVTQRLRLRIEIREERVGRSLSDYSLMARGGGLETQPSTSFGVPEGRSEGRPPCEGNVAAQQGP